MPSEITMPQQSDTMTEGTVVKWRKNEGDKVKAGDTIAEIETDKAVMEMEAFDSGTLADFLVKEGEKVPVGAVLAVIASAKDDTAAIKAKYASGRGASKAPAKAAGASASVDGGGAKAQVSAKPAPAAAMPAKSTPAATAP